MSRLSLAPLALLGAAAGLILAGCGGGGGSSSSPAVTQKVTGFITDADTAAPVVGAVVKVKGTSISVSTLADGSYTVGPLNPTRAYDMLISLPGYIDSAVKILSTNSTLQAPAVILTKGAPPVTITGTTGGTAPSNASIGGSTAKVDVPANALPGGAATASVATTLITGSAVPGAATDNTQVVYPAVNLGVSGATGDFTVPVTMTFPLPFAMTVGATIPVVKLGTDGTWAPVVAVQANALATVNADGISASFLTVKPGTYGLSLPLHASAQITDTTTTQIQGPYTDPVVYDLTGTTINWSVQGADARDALDSSFVQGQRQGTVSITGDPDATQLVIHPRGTALIEVVKDKVDVTVTGSGVTIQQSGSSATGSVDNLAHAEIIPHQQGSGSSS
jgi:hypothetical protein